MNNGAFREYLEREGLSLHKAARKFGKSVRTITNWKSGQPMSRKNAEYMSQKTGIPEAVLIGVPIPVENVQ